MKTVEHDEDLHAELGYRTAGRREVAQCEWFSLRGDAGEVAPTPKAFAKLVNVLRVTKWQRENPERRKEIEARYYSKPGVAARQVAQERKRRLLRHRKNAPVITCLECGAEFCEAFPRRGSKPRKFCTETCGARNVQARKRRENGERELHCGVCGAAGHNARRHQ